MPMDVTDKPVNLKSLEMAKKRDKKVYITDIAIDKLHDCFQQICCGCSAA